MPVRLFWGGPWHQQLRSVEGISVQVCKTRPAAYQNLLKKWDQHLVSHDTVYYRLQNLTDVEYHTDGTAFREEGQVMVYNGNVEKYNLGAILKRLRKYRMTKNYYD